MSKKVSPEQKRRSTDKRIRIWRHNALFGSLGMARNLTRCVIEARSTTSAAKDTAQQIDQLLTQLRTELKTRIDLP